MWKGGKKKRGCRAKRLRGVCLRPKKNRTKVTGRVFREI